MLNVIAVNPANENATLGATAMMDGGLTLRSATGSLGSSGEEAFSASQGFGAGEAYMEGGFETSMVVQLNNTNETALEGVVGEAESSQYSESGSSGVSTSSCNTENDGNSTSGCGSGSDLEAVAENVVETQSSTGRNGVTSEGIAASGVLSRFSSIGSFNASGTFGSASGYAAGESRIGSGNYGKGFGDWKRIGSNP